MRTEKPQTQESLRIIENWMSITSDYDPTELEGTVPDEFLPLIRKISQVLTNSRSQSQQYSSRVSGIDGKSRTNADHQSTLEYVNQLSSVSGGNTLIMKELETRDQRIQKKDQRIDNLKTIIEKKEKLLGSLRLRVSELEEEVENHKGDAEEVEKIKEKLDEYERNRQRERDNYLRNTEMVQAECNDKVSICNKKIAELEKSLCMAQEENSKLSSTIKEATENANSVIHESAVLSNKVKQLDEENKTLLLEKSNLEEMVSTLSMNQTEIDLQNENAEEQETREIAIEEEEQQQEEVCAEEEQQQKEVCEEEQKEEICEEEQQKEVCEEEAKEREIEENESTEAIEEEEEDNDEEEDDDEEEEAEDEEETVSAKFIVENLAEFAGLDNEETEENAKNVILKAKKKALHIQKKYGDAREVIKTVNEIVHETTPEVCHETLSKIFV